MSRARNQAGAARSIGYEDDYLDSSSQPDEHTRLLPNRLDSSFPPPNGTSVQHPDLAHHHHGDDDDDDDDDDESAMGHRTATGFFSSSGGGGGGGVPFLLSPDDPAVSAYNLWSVRLAYRLTLALAVLAVLWLALLVASLFLTPPGLHVRSSAFSAALLAAALAVWSLAASLAFFTAPSAAGRALCLGAAALMALASVVAVAVRGLRVDEGAVGIITMAGAALAAAWAAAVDRLVRGAKAAEEERLTGRAETRRSVGEWGAVSAAVLARAVAAVAALLLVLTLMLRAADASMVPPPGRMVWVDGDRYRLHLFCSGDGKEEEHLNQTGGLVGGPGATSTPSPTTTVLFEGGEEAMAKGLWQFAENAVKNGSIARYCFADRPGIAWSDAAPSPFSGGIAADVLTEALARAGETGPWVLASAGVGSLYSRIFSSRHRHGVRGILMVDPVHEDQLGVAEDGSGGVGRGFFLWLRGFLSPLGLPDRLPGALFRGRSAAERVWGSAARRSTSKTIFAAFQERLVAEWMTRRDVRSSRAIQDRTTPVAVVSSGERVRRNTGWKARQHDLTRITDRLEGWDVVEGAPHEVWATWEGREAMERRLRALVRL